MTLAEIIQTLIKPDDLALLPEGSLERAIQMALERYSADFPRESIIDLNSKSGVLNMPPDWERGWSHILSLEYPIEGVIVSNEQAPDSDGSTRYLSALAEPVSIGQPVRLSNSFLMQAAATLERFDAVGIVVQADPTHAVYTSDGSVELTDWTAIVGSALLTPDSRYFLQLTPGLLGTTPPDDAPVVQLGRALNETTLDVEIEITL